MLNLIYLHSKGVPWKIVLGFTRAERIGWCKVLRGEYRP